MRKKAEILKYLKLLSGALLAVGAADLMHLKFAYAAGIITLLTIQDTKKETLLITLKRGVIFIIMTILSIFVFGELGYSLAAFGAVLTPYLFVCMALHMKEAIAPIAVLCTHYISEQSISPEMISNEFLILAVGAGTGIFLNAFIPDNRLVMKRKLQAIEDKMRENFAAMAAIIENRQETVSSGDFFGEIDAMLQDLRTEARIYSNNHLWTGNDYYYDYVVMRMEQGKLLKQIYQDITRLYMIPEQAEKVAEYFKEMAENFHETNNAESLLQHLEELHSFFREDRLPETRNEFENRALLFHILESMRSLVLLKSRFYQLHRQAEPVSADGGSKHESR